MLRKEEEPLKWSRIEHLFTSINKALKMHIMCGMNKPWYLFNPRSVHYFALWCLAYFQQICRTVFFPKYCLWMTIKPHITIHFLEGNKITFLKKICSPFSNVIWLTLTSFCPRSNKFYRVFSPLRLHRQSSVGNVGSYLLEKNTPLCYLSENICFNYVI